ncbi:MAG: ribbon-helix-helix protein, CopG family [SAR202 cluster bacterium]|nr:ribbon-helix-helix protein, CopG family [SAR202 cluster bacterium]
MAKIAISLPDSVLDAVEKKRKSRGQSRSDFFRQAAEALLKRETEAIQKYIQGYLKYPETREGLDWLQGASREVLNEYPWDSEDDK